MPLLTTGNSRMNAPIEFFNVASMSAIAANPIVDTTIVAKQENIMAVRLTVVLCSKLFLGFTEIMSVWTVFFFFMCITNSTTIYTSAAMTRCHNRSDRPTNEHNKISKLMTIIITPNSICGKINMTFLAVEVWNTLDTKLQLLHRITLNNKQPMVCGNYSFGASSNVSDTKTHIGIIGYLSPSLSYYLVVLQIQNNQKSLYYTKLIVIIIVIFRNNYISKISHTIAPICYTLTLRSN